MRRPFLFPLLPPADRQLLGPRRCATMPTPSAIFLASSPRYPQLQRRLQFLSRLRLRRQIHHRPRFQSRLHRHLQIHRHLHRPHHLIHLHHLGHRCLYPFHHRRRSLVQPRRRFPCLLLHPGHRCLSPFHHRRRSLVQSRRRFPCLLLHPGHRCLYPFHHRRRSHHPTPTSWNHRPHRSLARQSRRSRRLILHHCPARTQVPRHPVRAPVRPSHRHRRWRACSLPPGSFAASCWGLRRSL